MIRSAIAVVAAACLVSSAVLAQGPVDRQAQRTALATKCRDHGIIINAFRSDNKDRSFNALIIALEGGQKLCAEALGYLDELIAKDAPATAPAVPPGVVPSERVLEVAAMVLDPSMPVLMRRHEVFNGQPMGTTVVFVHKGKRYSLYHSSERITPENPNSAWLSFWVRRNGTSGQHNMLSFTDNGFNGKVNFGIDGLRQRYFNSGDRHSPAAGLEHQAFWQKELDAAIKAALDYKRRVTKKSRR